MARRAGPRARDAAKPTHFLAATLPYYRSAAIMRVPVGRRHAKWGGAYPGASTCSRPTSSCKITDGTSANDDGSCRCGNADCVSADTTGLFCYKDENR